MAAPAFALAGLSVALDWARVSGFGASAGVAPLDDHAIFRISDLVDLTAPWDAIVVILMAAAGLAALAAGGLGRLSAGPSRALSGLAGSLPLALGVAEIQYVLSRPSGGGSISAAVGLYLLAASGAVIVGSGWIPSPRRGRSQR